MDDGAAVALFGVMGLLYLVVILLAIAGFVFWIVALIDCLKREFAGENEKLIWIIVLVATFVIGSGLIGALIYWFVGRPKGVMRG